jgi:predicted metal-binding membrane protein
VDTVERRDQLFGTFDERLVGVLKRDRVIILSGLVAAAALAWVYLLYLARGMRALATGALGMGAVMPHVKPWTAVDFTLMFLMWSVMMVAMMIPTAAPMILAFAAISRKRHEQRRPYVPTAVFVAAYVVVWCGFSLLATLSNWALHRGGFMSSMMGSAVPSVGGLILVASGVFQWTPLKHACLWRCRTPLGFLMTEWREGYRGALVMGLRHGSFCLICCWALMALLFVLGVMNILWIAALTVFVLLEKVGSKTIWISRASGAFLVVWGLSLIGARMF